MKSQQSSTVPKFSSFKAKKIPEFSQTGEQRPSEPDSGHSRREDDSETRRESRKHHRKHTRRKEFELHGLILDKDVDNSQTADAHGKILSEYLESDDNFFRIDRKGDPANLTYRGLERSKVPRYYRVGQGRILGVHPAYRIDRTLSNDSWVVLEVPGHVRLDNASPLQASRRALQRSLEQPTRFVRSSKNSEDLPTDVEAFIPLKHGRKRKRGSDVTDNGEVGYRSMEKSDSEKNRIDISDWESSSESNYTETDTQADGGAQPAKQRNAELALRTKEMPEDLQAWLDL